MCVPGNVVVPIFCGLLSGTLSRSTGTLYTVVFRCHDFIRQRAASQFGVASGAFSRGAPEDMSIHQH